MVKVGVLALQGSVIEHINMLSKIEDVIPCEVKNVEELHEVMGLILPGGESTTIGKLIKEYGLNGPIVKKALAGMPIWGTCAGMILMAREIEGESYKYLGIMDISVRRNAYGSQLDSFSKIVSVPGVSKEEIPLVFIRAPWVESVGSNVEVLAKVDGKIVAVRQDNMLATSFHTELTLNLAFHKYFFGMVREYAGV